MDRARAPRVTEPLASAVLEHAKRSWGGVGRCVVIYHVRARVTDEKERHLPRPPHPSASPAISLADPDSPVSVSISCSVFWAIRFIGRSMGCAPLAAPLPLISGAALGSLRAWCVAPV